MNRRIGIVVALVFLAAAGLMLATRAARTSGGSNDAGTPVTAKPKLSAIGPKLLSNQTSQPITLYGERFTQGLSLELGAPLNEVVRLEVVDDTLAFARLPGGLDLPADQTLVVVKAKLEGGEGEVELSFVNDADYPDFFAIAVTSEGDRYVISPTTDTLYVLRGEDPAFKVKTADGPSAIATANDRVWVAHRYSKVLRAYVGLVQAAELPAPDHASALIIDSPRGVAYVAETARDTVSALALDSGRELWRTPVLPNPGALARCGEWLAVGSWQTGEIELVNAATGKPEAPISPGPDVSIVGGGTEKFASRTMGGKAPRALLCDEKRNVLFVSSIGPNIGPNPEKMEVSMNGGVGVIDLETRRFVRHLGFGAGVTEGLALDAEKGILYAADIGTGVVRSLDVKALLASDAKAKTALAGEIAMPVREGFPLIRAEADFGSSGRSGKELHSGPRAVVFEPNLKELFVLNRHTGVVARADGKAFAVLDDVKAQAVRRKGQVLYYADLGRTAMTCDSCHIEGHTEGLLFEKTQPLRIYRSPTVRGTRDTPPYFIPASTFSVAETAKVVGGRNRFHNPDLTMDEVEALATFSAAITLLPNPFRDEKGAPLPEMDLPDGAKGRPLEGRKVFDKQRCAECHPPPLFTTDQDAVTRGKHVDTGTPHVFPLRTEFQDATFKGFPPPSLLGNWDVWPQLTTGLAGFDVTSDGKLRVKARYATRAVLEEYSGQQHGNAQTLSPQDRNDLLAFLLSL